jgi:hypothetical protein
MSSTVPTDTELCQVFHSVADIIIGDTFQCHIDEGVEKDFEMSRNWVAEYLNTHGGKLGEKVSDWIANTPNWQEICDEARVPSHWVE